MDQDNTWYGGRPRPRPYCARWGPSPLPKKGAQPPIFGPCLLWPNGSMDQDGTCYDGRPLPGQHWVRCGPILFPKVTATPKFRPMSVVPKGWMDQDATWYEGRPRPRLGCIVLHGNPTPPPKRGTPPIFGASLLWPNGRPSQLLLSTCFMLAYVIL